MNHDDSNRAWFGPFEVDLRTHEIWEEGVQFKLMGQPFEILMVLISRPGELVSREELRTRLWPKDTFVDFDHGLNAAVNKLREALNDSAENPQYVQTLPRLGYRFIAPVTKSAQQSLPGKQVQARWMMAAAGILLVGLVALGADELVRVRTRQVNYAGLTPVPLTSYPGTELAPSFSPDGNQVVFEWFQASSPREADLYVKQVGQEHVVRLTNHRAQFLEPAWSPDGRNIAFEMQEKGAVGLYVIPSLGGPERQLLDLGKLNPFSRISWSADSEWLAFTKADTAKTDLEQKPYRIHLINIDTREEREWRVASAECVMSLHPTFSPDGKYLASDCSLGRGAGNKIYVQRAGGTDAHEIAFVSTQIMWLDGLAWAPDGRSVLYAAQGGLWRVPLSGGSSEKLPFGESSTMPAIARAGNRLTYAAGTGTSRFDLWQVELSDTSKSKGLTRKLAPSNRNQQSARFSPDGRRIVFDSDRSGDPEIWLAENDGSNPVQLTNLKARTGTPRWSPDGRNITFDSSASGHSEIYVVSVNGGQPRRLETGRPSAAHPYWSSDGRWIYFTSEQPMSVWKVPSTGGKAVALTREGRYFPQESLDGKRVFYVIGGEDGAELWSVSVDGGDERREQGVPKLPLDAAWTPTGKGIYYISGTPGKYTVSCFEFASRKQHTVATLYGINQVMPNISVSPNGGTLLYTGSQSSESDLMLVEGFR